MKNIKTLLLASLLMGTKSMAMTSKVENPELVKGTSIGKYAKPGAPVDITYITEHVDVGEESHIHIVLSSRMTSGNMHVKIHLDKGLEANETLAKSMTIPMKADKGEYPIDFKVSADEDGLYYVKFLVSIKKKGFRAFAVPVYVGSGVLKNSKKSIQKTKNGENIVVSPAQETIIKK